MVKSWETENNFFKSNPHLEILLMDMKKALSNKMIWAIAFYADKNSPLYSYDSLTRRRLIEENYLEGKLNWADYESWCETYSERTKNRTERLLDEWSKDLETRRSFMRGAEYSVDTYEMLEKMMGNTYKLMTEYARLLKELGQQGDDGMSEGGAMESLNDQNLI